MMRSRREREGRQRARELRRSSTPAERILWEQLRDRRCQGLKFRRQAPLYGYVADFYCREVGLIVELDGEVHATPRQADHDANRDRILAARGLRLLRLHNREIQNDLSTTLARILEAAHPPDQQAAESPSTESPPHVPPLPLLRERGPGGEGPATQEAATQRASPHARA